MLWQIQNFLIYAQFDCVWHACLRDTQTWRQKKSKQDHSLVILSNQMQNLTQIYKRLGCFLLVVVVFFHSCKRTHSKRALSCHSCNLPFDDVNASTLIFSTCWGFCSLETNGIYVVCVCCDSVKFAMTSSWFSTHQCSTLTVVTDC